MSLLGPRTLKWRLIGRLAAAQGIVLAVLMGINSLVVSTLWLQGYLGQGYNRAMIEALKGAIDRDAAGRLIVRPTPALAQLRREIGNPWFVVEDGMGQRLSEGRLPAPVLELLPMLGRLDDAGLASRSSGDSKPYGLVEWIQTRAGEVHVVADVRGAISKWTVLSTIGSTFEVVLTVIVIMVLATLLVTPFVVRRALAGLSGVADQAARIDIRRSSVRLPVDDVPDEVVPLVTAMNEALERLDQGHDRHKRFLSDAAHELRTPIAILQARVSDLPKSDARVRLLEDAGRLTVLAGQLLDLQRLEQPAHVFRSIDLVPLIERVVLDLAPLAFAAGYEMSVDAEIDSVRIKGDESAIERAVTNLLQNAIDHGGRSGEISIWVSAVGTISVCDDGAGIPPEERDAVFEPFRRLSYGGRGAGLGLDLVQRTMRLHGGRAELFAGEKRGACFRLIFEGALRD